MAEDHHPLVLGIDRRPVNLEPEFVGDQLLESRYRWVFCRGLLSDFTPPTTRRTETPPLPSLDDEYFEWIDILETIEEARDRRDQYVFIELGAGFGRWTARAGLAARRAGLPFHAIAVEAEPQHFAYLRQHLSDHALHAVECVHAAVSPSREPVRFRIGRADSWYGQSIANPMNPTDDETTLVPTVQLSTLLGAHPAIDLVDMDVQRAEAGVIEESITTLTARARRVHISTHGKGIEREIRSLFNAHGWIPRWYFARKQTNFTPYGEIRFQDGVQTWINPRLRS